MQELGPFRVAEDNKTLSRNINAWNNGKYVPMATLIPPPLDLLNYRPELTLLVKNNGSG